MNKPIIGAINGAAITGGFEISLSCDLLAITPETRFADTHARIGLIAGWGWALDYRVQVDSPGQELSLTGNFLSAQQAYEWVWSIASFPKKNFCRLVMSWLGHVVLRA